MTRDKPEAAISTAAPATQRNTSVGTLLKNQMPDSAEMVQATNTSNEATTEIGTPLRPNATK